MVCIPCILMPFLLFVWHSVIQPLILKFWNPWQQEKEEMELELKLAAKASKASKKKGTANGCPLKDTSGTQISAPIMIGKDKDM